MTSVPWPINFHGYYKATPPKLANPTLILPKRELRVLTSFRAVDMAGKLMKAVQYNGYGKGPDGLQVILFLLHISSILFLIEVK